MAGSGGRDLRDGLSAVTFGTVALVGATLLLVGLNFLARVLVVRSVSTTDWNAFSLGFTLAQVLAAVGAFGFPVAVARSLPYALSDAERRTIVRTSLWTGGLAAGVAGAALVLAAPTIGADLSSPELGLGLEFFAVAVSSMIASTLLASVFQGFADVRPNALFVQVLNPALFLAFLGAALFVPPERVTYRVALVGYAAANALTLLALVVYSARRLPARLPRAAPDRHARTGFLALLVPLAVLGAMTSVAGSGDTLVLGAEHYGEVGGYSVSLTLARLVQVGIGAASYIFLPVASRFLSRRDRRAVGLTYATLTKWLTVFSLPLFVVFFFLPTGSLEFVYGSSYTSVVLPLEIVVLGAFVGTLLGPGSVTQVALGETRLLAYNAIAAGLTDVLLALWLVPGYGDVGAAIAWATANVLFASLCVSELAVFQKLSPLGRNFFIPLLATLVPAGAVLSLTRPTVPLLALPVVAVLVALLFLTAVVLTRSVGEGDRLLLEAVEGWTGRRIPLARAIGRAGLSRRPTRSSAAEPPAGKEPLANSPADRPRP